MSQVLKRQVPIPAKATNADRALRQQMAALDHWASSPLGCSSVTCRIADSPVKAAETSYEEISGAFKTIADYEYVCAQDVATAEQHDHEKGQCDIK